MFTGVGIGDATSIGPAIAIISVIAVALGIVGWATTLRHPQGR